VNSSSLEEVTNRSPVKAAVKAENAALKRELADERTRSSEARAQLSLLEGEIATIHRTHTAEAAKRKRDSRTNHARGVRRASRRLERGLKDVTAEVVRKGAEIKELRRRFTVVEAALDEATEQASKAEAEAGATKEKLVEEKMETKEFRESHKDLKERLAELENAVFVLEEKFEE